MLDNNTDIDDRDLYDLNFGAASRPISPEMAVALIFTRTYLVHTILKIAVVSKNYHLF